LILSYADGAAAISGVIVGFVLGLIGGGGSVFATPLLYYFVGVPSPHVAIGTGAAAVTVNALASLVGHARAGRVRWPCAFVFAAAGTCGALIGSSLGKVFDGQKLLMLFGVLMLVVATQMFFKRPPPEGHDFHLTRANARQSLPAMIGVGSIVGALAGFFGIGGGFLVVPGILATTNMPMIAAVGTSLVSVTAFGLATASNYAWSGLVDWRIMTIVVAGGLVGGLFGGALAGRLAPRRQALTKVFAVLVAMVGLYVIYRGALYLTHA
jgi:uncharacterized membrane protein YfcA